MFWFLSFPSLVIFQNNPGVLLVLLFNPIINWHSRADGWCATRGVPFVMPDPISHYFHVQARVPTQFVPNLHACAMQWASPPYKRSSLTSSTRTPYHLPLWWLSLYVLSAPHSHLGPVTSLCHMRFCSEPSTVRTWFSPSPQHITEILHTVRASQVSTIAVSM